LNDVTARSSWAFLDRLGSMVAGPAMLTGLRSVTRFELITTARRGRYYMLRLIYGLILLFMLSARYQTWEATHPGGGTVEEVRLFSEGAFIEFGQMQGWAILWLIPALVAGVIADEHQRKTLHYLLASRLSSLEIVLGKLGARLVHVGVLVALGLPIVCLLSLYGGLNPENLLMIYGTTGTTILFLTGLSILVSTLARRPRDALMVAYGLEFFWLFVPPFLQPFAHHLGWPYDWVGPVNDWALMTNPLVLWNELIRFSNAPVWWRGRGFRMGTLWESIYWLSGLQAGLGLLFLFLAVAGLRPFRGSSWPGSEPQKGWFTRLVGSVRRVINAPLATPLARNRLLATPVSRPACGDRPMFWKERYTSLGGGLRWLGSRPVSIFLVTLLFCWLAEPVWSLSASQIGMQWSSSPDRARAELLRELQVATWLLTTLGLLIVASTAAVSLTAEREHDTWTSLGTTLLSPGEIVHAKQFGAGWNARWVGMVLLLIWSLGALLGLFHPLAVLAAVSLLVVSCWFFAAMGVLVSVVSPNSTRATVVTLLALAILGSWWVPTFLTGIVSMWFIPGLLDNPLGLDGIGLPWFTTLWGAVAVLAWCMTRIASDRLGGAK
jgi:hypothetical protein